MPIDNMNDELRERFNKWFGNLANEEQNEVRILDAYFMSRSQYPNKSITGEDYIEEDKSTQDIIDDLSDMWPLSTKIVTTYMQLHEFGMTTSEDGKVKWAIWRNYNHPL